LAIAVCWPASPPGWTPRRSSTSDSAPIRCSSTGPTPRPSALVRISATLASPLLARMSTWVPPAKSMPKFMPTNRNISTETIDSAADSG
jgi:hypothetical protein